MVLSNYRGSENVLLLIACWCLVDLTPEFSSGHYL